MGYKSVWFGLCCILFAYYIYTPLPEAIEEPWKVMVVDAGIKLTSMTAILFENIGLMKYEELFLMLITLDYTEAISDENVTVTDTTFGGISVRLYLPKNKSERQKPAVIYVHGGAFVLGSCKQTAYDSLNRWTANKLGAVVVGVDYRSPPRYQFPVSLEDVVSVVKFFLKDDIVVKYGVDPTRVCITGDSSGGSLAAKATQLLQNDPDFKIKIKAQALIYPCLQVFDTSTPSHQDNEQGPILSRDLAIRLAHLYLANDKALHQAMSVNQHMPQESRHLFKYVNWSILLPDKFKKNHVYTEPIFRRLNPSYPELMDSKLSPLVANDSELQNLPLTYIATCQYDILRDDGLLYVTRLQNLGVQVTHDHLEDGFHGALSLMTSPVYLRLGMKIKDKYISWLEKNL
ncbi:arylacetamide deacetylase-like 2 [Ochotona princeps]|uniref:arylacetamide deacetylase-like 2 n=1 Tax=Ochotona princeps TaxID=9978 RepID=UPI0027145603|nr:arylacetamide deacetylase-like 2 [Ochotona princeps]